MHIVKLILCHTIICCFYVCCVVYNIGSRLSSYTAEAATNVVNNITTKTIFLLYEIWVNWHLSPSDTASSGCWVTNAYTEMKHKPAYFSVPGLADCKMWGPKLTNPETQRFNLPLFSFMESTVSLCASSCSDFALSFRECNWIKSSVT